MLISLVRLLRRVRVCRSPAGLPAGTIVLFPVSRVRLPCGLAGILEIVSAGEGEAPSLEAAERAVAEMAGNGLSRHPKGGEEYAGGAGAIAALSELVREIRRPESFPVIFADALLRGSLAELGRAIREFAAAEVRLLDSSDALPDLAAQEEVNHRLTLLKDVAWAIERELLPNVDRVGALLGAREATAKAVREYRKANLILNSIDRMEIRGRDSAGILFQVAFPDAAALEAVLAPHREEVDARAALLDLPDGSVTLAGRTVTFVYKVAAEVGKLGDNVATLRSRLAGDAPLFDLLAAEESSALVLAHTRWASNGIINVANCHPLDNDCRDAPSSHIHVALNGDIDNYLVLKRRFEEETGRRISGRITTDAKVIALWVDHCLAEEGMDLGAAFRRAVRDFEGSAAIFMTSDLEPGRLYLSLKGSGQSLYVGLPPAGFIVASEIYGLVEETDRFVKLEGERERVPGDATTRGQIFVLDPDSEPGPESIRAFHHDGVEVELLEDDVRCAEITTRDVDRGDFPHYFLKEVSQAAESVAKTLRGKFSKDGRPRLGVETISADLSRLLEEGSLERIMVIGQGTASVAAMAVAAFLADSLRGSGARVQALKASELSGFGLEADMSRTLVVAVTQSGATADTNRAVDLARERGAQTIAIVNRRNSDITFKTAGVLYTSDGRDVEMSVASTKAFYSQVVAGAVLGLALGHRTGALSQARVNRELADLRELPRLLEEVFARGSAVAEAAERLAPTRRYWTVVGSGPNRIAAEEVRIKLSELCYKSISADSVEDKKHIDLSSESMILVLASGNSESVLSDLAKDVAIFKAHRALPIVFAADGDRRFDEYAAAVIEVPAASPLLSMVLLTMAGHLFGYHAARAIDEGARFLTRIRSVVVGALDRVTPGSLGDLGHLQREYRTRLRGDRFASAIEADTAADLLLLLKYAAGEIPPISFRDEYGLEPGQREIQEVLLERLVDAIDQTQRSVDAIKHQAKIVTVGTSRLEDLPTGVIFDSLSVAGVPISAITFSDRAALARVQPALAAVTGLTRYTVEGLEIDGTPGEGARVRVTERTGTAAGIPSRAEGGARLKGTKRSVVSERRSFVGVGAKDGRRICIVPLVDHRFAVNALVLLHLEFRASMSLEEKLEALGDRYDEIVNGVTEADVAWSDDLLDPFAPEILFTTRPARLAEQIVGRAGGA